MGLFLRRKPRIETHIWTIPMTNTTAPEIDMAEANQALREKWQREWDAAKEAAIAALDPEEAKYEVWQDRDTGWWRVGVWRLEISPTGMWGGPGWSYDHRKKPPMEVRAWRSRRAFEPTFKSAAEAVKWLRAGLQPTALRFDESGTELPSRSGPL